MGDENTVSNNEVDARKKFAQMKQGENMTSNESLKGKLSNSSSDLRSTALDCHAKISKELWGKKEAASSISLLPVAETEAYAIDTAIRIFWSLLRNEDELNQCSLSPQLTKKLRIIALDTLNKYKEQLTKEYSFLIPDPAVIKQREDEKQKLLSSANNARKQRMEQAKKDREERQRRMKEKLQPSASEADVKSLVQKSADEAKGDQKTAGDKAAVPKRTFPLVKGQSFAAITRSSSPAVVEAPQVTAAPIGGVEPRKKISVPIIIKPTTSIKVTATNSNPPSSSSSSASSEKKELPAAAPRKSLGALEKFQQQQSASKQQKSFVIPTSVKRRDNAAASAAKEPANTQTTANEAAGSPSSDNNEKEQNQQAQNPPTNENANEKAQNQEEEPVPMITVKQQLLDTDQLNRYLQERVIDEFIQIVKNQKPSEVGGGEKNNFDFYHYTVKGPRPANEDEFTVVEHLNEYLDLPDSNGKYSFIAVYDGHSGKYTSLYARSQLHYKACNRPEFFNDPEKAIYETILQVDELVNDIQTKNQFACGTTALSCWIKNKEEIYVANVGDCRGFICRNSEAMEIAKPHHPDLPDEKARIVNNGGAVVWQGTWRVNGVLAVSRSIGDVNMKRWVIPNPDITKFTIQPTDEFMVLASDGLWDVIKPNEMIDIVRSTVKTLGRKHVCKLLCETALQKNTKDNVTVVVIFFTNESD